MKKYLLIFTFLFLPLATNGMGIKIDSFTPASSGLNQNFMQLHTFDYVNPFQILWYVDSSLVCTSNVVYSDLWITSGSDGCSINNLNSNQEYHFYAEYWDTVLEEVSDVTYDIYPRFGCMDSEAPNYDSLATDTDYYCTEAIPIYGCTNTEAINYDPEAEADDGSCILKNMVVATTTANIVANTTNVGLAIIITILFVGISAFVYNSISKKKKWH